MPDIRLHRAHPLGLARARQIARAWAEQAERDFGLECRVHAGDAGDTVEFQRTGVSGRLVVTADHFDLEARLGFLLGAFARKIEAEVTKNLDALLAGEAVWAGQRIADGARISTLAPAPTPAATTAPTKAGKPPKAPAARR